MSKMDSKKPVFAFRETPRQMPSRIPLELRRGGDWGELYGRFGDPTYDPRIIGWTEVTAANMTIEFTVRVPAGGSAECVLRARSYDGAEVGRRTVVVTAPAGAITAEGRERVPTTARASHGDVVRCRPPG